MNLVKKYNLLIFLFLFLIFFKSDFRIINELRCCQDDFDYYSHALTIAKDFDFDYSNQISNNSRYYNENTGKVAPMGFFGPGLLASPFLFLGNILDNIFNVKQDILNFKKLLYSFSSIFYLYFSFFLLIKSLNQTKLFFSLPLALSGSGIIYYAFERYSMPHVYEIFTVSLLIYLSDKFYKDESHFSSALIPLAISIGFIVRWTNYYLFFIPLIVFLLSKDNKKRLLREKYFYFSSALAFSLFLLHTKLIYGVFTFSPFLVYGEENLGTKVYESLFVDFFQTLYQVINDIFIILFTQEFGLFWFSSVLFACLFMLIVNFFKYTFKLRLAVLLVFLSFAQGFYTISIWNSTASSYGFRYIFSLIPLAIFLLAKLGENKKNTLFKHYINYFSIFGILSVLFFETTEATQLSLVPVINSFGVEKIYSQPDYLSGVVMSFFEINSYLKIFATSFFGALAIKAFLIIFGLSSLESIILNLNLSNKEDLIDLVIKIETIDLSVLVVSFLFSIYVVFLYVNLIFKNSSD